MLFQNLPPVQIRSAELIGALSHALDLTEGQPKGHCMRTCWMGMKLGMAINMPREELSDLFYTLLLKDLGCSSNAARICQLYLADDRKFKTDFKMIDGSLSQALRFVLNHTGLESGMIDRFRAIVNIMKNGGEISRELIEARCHRGADIARQMGFNTYVAEAIQNLDEHWDGSGKPEGKVRRAIPIASQIALMSQVADVFNISQGHEAATREIKSRADTWFDPDLVSVFSAIADWEEFWSPLQDENLAEKVLALEPIEHVRLVDEDYMDCIAKGFAMVVDSKSPFTAGHSERVAVYADMIAEKLGLGPSKRRWLRRAALLHDIGKLAISNQILDKPERLTDAEFDVVKTHPRISAEILSGIAAFKDIVAIAGGHHERIDGEGYPYGLKGDQIPLETRIVTVADVFDAITADRPYRKAQPIEQALLIISKELGTAFDKRCYEALVSALQESNLRAA
jgi:putative nucleotidyltransferase with HDIG domain